MTKSGARPFRHTRLSDTSFLSRMKAFPVRASFCYYGRHMIGPLDRLENTLESHLSQTYRRICPGFAFGVWLAWIVALSPADLAEPRTEDLGKEFR